MIERFPVVALSWRNLSRAKARSALATLGILIGVVAIVSLGMFGATLQVFFLQDAQDALQTVSVSPGEDYDGQHLDRDDIARLEQLSDGSVYPVKRGFGVVTSGNTRTTTQVSALSNPGAFVSARDGRIPDIWRSGALVGADLADELGLQAGDGVTVDGQTYHVAAVLEESTQVSLLRPDSSVLLPRRQVDSEGFDLAIVRTSSPSAAFQTADRLRAELNSDRRTRYDVLDFEAQIQQFREQISVIQTFLLGVGAVSLLVAAVSILNVMLMSAIERREEIGVLRAVGYHRLDVLRLMLTEAVLLGFIGAVGGVLVSVGLGMVINELLLGDPMAFTEGALNNIALGVVFGVGAALLSGLYPAWKASNARPVDALRD
jgi:putative ABC transport system permease protein